VINPDQQAHQQAPGAPRSSLQEASHFPTGQRIPGTFPDIGSDDLNPFGGAGGGMLFDPFRGGPDMAPRGPGGPGGPGAPFPGARFDPTGPFGGPRPSLPRGTDPDHMPMPNKDWNNPFI